MIWQFLSSMSPIGRAVLALSLIGALGLVLGRLRVRGVSIGIGGVLFAGLLVGDLAARAHLSLDHGVLEFVREFGLILFVYTIGVQVGPGFFAALRKAGATLNLVAASIVVTGAGLAASLHLVAGVPLPAMLGILSGAVTNTPSLGAAQQVLVDSGAPAAAIATTGMGYAVAYPLGIVGILLAMTAIRAVLRIDPGAAARDFEARRRAETAELASLDVVLARPEFAGRALARLPGMESGAVTCSRLLRDGRLRVPHDTTWVEVGDVLHLIGPRAELDGLARTYGSVHRPPLTTEGSELTRESFVVTSDRVLGRSVAALDLERRFDVRIGRIDRAGTEFVARSGIELQFGDIVHAIGRGEDLAQLSAALGDARHRLKEFDPIPMFVGIGLGIALGSIDLSFGSLSNVPIRLGLAGGPLLAAIVLSHVGHVGPLVWYMPPTANHTLRELGIVLFLAVVGFDSGGHFVETLSGGDGLRWVLWGAIVTVVPLLVAGFLGALLAKIDYLTLCGLLAGSMTDPPALAFANAMAPSCGAQSLAYATVYPLVMGLRILSPQILVLILAAL
jgi:putative transport protein